MAFVRNQAFNSWDDFFSACKEYCDTNFQPMVKKGCKLTSVANAKLQNGQRPYPERFKYTNYIFLCTHSGTFKSEGEGKRKTGSKKFGCPGKIYAALNRERTQVVIKEIVNTHNHDIGPELYKHYVLNRQLSSEEKAQACELTRLGVDINVVQQLMLKTTGKPITTKDVRNLKTHMKVEGKGMASLLKDGVNTPISLKGLSSKEQGFSVSAESMIDTKPFDETSPPVSTCVLREPCVSVNAETKDLLAVSQTKEHNYLMMKSQGLVAGNFESLLDFFIEPTDPLLNGFIVRSMHISTVKNYTYKCRQIAQKLGLCDSVVFQTFFSAIVKLMKNVKLFRKCLSRDWHKLVDLLNTPFTYITYNNLGRVKSTVISVTPTEDSHTSNLELVEVDTAGMEISSTQEDGPKVAIEGVMKTSQPGVPGFFKSEISVKPTEDSHTSNLELVEVEVDTAGMEISSTQEDGPKVAIEGVMKTSQPGVPGFFKSSDHPRFSTAGKQMTTAENKRSIMAKHRLQRHSCSKSHISNQALLKSKNKIRDRRKKCLTLHSPKIENLQQVLKIKSLAIEMLMKSESTELKTAFYDWEKSVQDTTDLYEGLQMKHTILQNKMKLLEEKNEQNLLAFVSTLKSNHTELRRLKAEVASLKAENKKLVEENNTLNDKLSTELILPIVYFNPIK
ncbi:uncharacterized protein LOC131953290 isoform X2 [Physella acuta]|uniref:uncharacterized protein LOC131953290 isoform X2 n=1 Tax=Physella acuta TaxID=109671 RepID=UPI0027DD5225|nr:uncharacterized protein LOC131953290 isoform X2 [Physella acuta]